MERASRKVVGVVLLGLLTAVVAGGCGSPRNKAGGTVAEKPIELTMAEPDRGVVDTEEFTSAVRRLSGNALHIRERVAWRHDEIDYDRGLLADLRAGKIDLAKIAVRSLDELGVTDFQPLVAPLAIDSLRLEQAVLEDPMSDHRLRGLRRLGVVGVAIVPGGLRRPFGLRHTLASPADFRGRVFGIRPSLLSAATARALGATPRTYLSGTMPAALDGAELDLRAIEGNRFDERGTSLAANVSLWPRVFVVVANAERWQSLTAGQRALLRRAGKVALAPAIAHAARDEAEAASTLCRRGMLTFARASPRQLQDLETAVKPIYAHLRRNASARAFLDEIASIKRRLRAPAASIPSCGTRPTSAPNVGATPIDGVYRMTTTIDDLRRAGAPEEDLVPENYGHWTFVFDHGHFADTQEGSGACTWGYGTYTVAGHSTDWAFTDGGGTAPTGAFNRSGEEFRFVWSRYHGLLTLSPAAGSISPPNFRAKPWRLISSTPSRSYFSKHCPPPAAALAS